MWLSSLGHDFDGRLLSRVDKRHARNRLKRAEHAQLVRDDVEVIRSGRSVDSGVKGDGLRMLDDDPVAVFKANRKRPKGRLTEKALYLSSNDFGTHAIRSSVT